MSDDAEMVSKFEHSQVPVISLRFGEISLGMLFFYY